MIKIEFTNSLNEILNIDSFFYQFLIDWLPIQRWSGLEGKEIKDIKIKNKLLIKNTDNIQLIFLIIKCTIKSVKKTEIIEFFIPFIIHLVATQSAILSLKCKDGEFFLSYANNLLSYYQILFQMFINNPIKEMGKGCILNLEWYQIPKSDITGFKILGGGDTTNSIVKIDFKDENSLIFKEYRVIRQQREVKILQFLNKNNFNYSPKIFGTLGVRINNILYEIGIIMEYIDSIGDGGTLFWQNILNYLEIVIKRDKFFENKTELINFLKNDEELHELANNLIDTVFSFHKTMEKFDNSSEIINEEDVVLSLKNDKKFIQNINDVINSKTKDVNFDPIRFIYDIIFVNDSDISDILADGRILIGFKKIHCHQDLHFSQMLTMMKDQKIKFYLIDFEGDPLLPFQLKMKKDVIFRDLASLFAALFYIRFNALKETYSKYFEPKNDFNTFIVECEKSIHSIEDNWTNITEKFEQIMIFSDYWIKYLIDIFSSKYFKYYESKNIDNFDKIGYKQLISRGLKLHIIERALREINYELTHRPKNTIIPFLTIWKIITNDFFE